MCRKEFQTYVAVGNAFEGSDWAATRTTNLSSLASIVAVGSTNFTLVELGLITIVLTWSISMMYLASLSDFVGM